MNNESRRKYSRILVFSALTLAVALALTATVATAQAKKGGTDRPLTGNYEIDFDGVNVAGEGNITHLGKIDVEGQFLVIPRPAFELMPWPPECVFLLTIDEPASGPAGTSIWTAANGDELSMENLAGPGDWTLCVHGDGTGSITANFEIVGGTGRFTGATGNQTTQFYIADLPAGAPPSEMTATVEGTISY